MRACVLSGLPNKSLRGIKGTSLIDISLSFLNVFLHCIEYRIKRKALQIELQGFLVYQTRRVTYLPQLSYRSISKLNVPRRDVPPVHGTASRKHNCCRSDGT